MTEFGGQGATRVLLRQALGGDEFLRVTWHQDRDVVVFSRWEHGTCTSATPVRVDEVGDLATLLVTALAARAVDSRPNWPAPRAADLVATDLRSHA